MQSLDQSENARLTIGTTTVKGCAHLGVLMGKLKDMLWKTGGLDDVVDLDRSLLLDDSSDGVKKRG